MANGNNRHYCSVTWRIYNYLNAPVEFYETLGSPEFITNFNEPIKWRLGIMKIRNRHDKPSIKIRLMLLTPIVKLRSTYITARFDVVSNSGNIYYRGDRKMSFQSAMSVESSSMYKNVFNNYRPNSDSPTLTITCYFVHDDPFNTNIYGDMRRMSYDLEKLSNSKKFSDLDLKLGKDKFHVHKAIVKARSKYIARILNENPNLTEIDLTKKCSENQLNGLIKYWYTGDIDELPRTLSPSTLNFLLNMQEVGLRRYIVPEVIEMSTSFEIAVKHFDWPMNENLEFCRRIKKYRPLKNRYTFGFEGSKLCLYPKGIFGNEDSIYLIFDLILESLPLCIEVYIKDKDGAEHGCRRKCFNEDIKVNGYKSIFDLHFEKFIKFINFQEKLEKDKDNKLMIVCRAWRCFGEKKCNTSSALCSDISTLPDVNPYTILADDMRKLLESKDCSDISLRIGNETFHAHKAVLAARSVYFETRFSGNLSQEREMPMNDVDTEDMSLILKYTYYAINIELHKMKLDSIVKLYRAVNKYDINRLPALCYACFNEETFKIILKLGQNISDEDLERLIFQNIEE